MVNISMNNSIFKVSVVGDISFQGFHSDNPNIDLFSSIITDFKDWDFNKLKESYGKEAKGNSR